MNTDTFKILKSLSRLFLPLKKWKSGKRNSWKHKGITKCKGENKSAGRSMKNNYLVLLPTIEKRGPNSN